MIRLADDSRYDTIRWFEAASEVPLDAACESIMVAFGRKHGLAELEIDCDTDGDELSVWAESRAAHLAFYITTRDRFLTPEAQVVGEAVGPRHPFNFALAWNSHRIPWEEERRIRAALVDTFKCQLVPLPRRYFA